MSDFITAIKRHGLARTNRFRVEIPLPNVVQDKFSDINDRPDNVFSKALDITKLILGRGGDYTRGLELTCDAVQVPGMNFLTSDRRANTTNVKLPYDVDYGDVQFSFYVSGDMLEKKILDAWQASIYDRDTHSFEYLENYSQDIVIHSLNERNEEVNSVTLYEAWPITQNSIDLNAGSNESQKVIIGFTYNHWREGVHQEPKENFLSSVDSPSEIFEALGETKLLNKVYDIVVGNNPGFTGEALWVYKKMSEVIGKYANISVTELAVIIATIKNDLSSNTDINATDKTTLSNIADQILDKIKR